MSRRFVLAALVVVSLLLTAAVPAFAAKQSHLVVSPSSVTFAAVSEVGGACPGAGCTYAIVTITNERGAPEKIVGAHTGAETVYWPTWAGTCNSGSRPLVLKSHESCTLQFGYRPTTHDASNTPGWITFESGTTLDLALYGPAS